MSTFRVTVGKDVLTFAAGHFITFGEEGLEPLHGHNYRVAVELTGDLDEHSLVYDFVALRRDMSDLLARLDHRILLATQNPRLRVVEGKGEIEVMHGDTRYVFPRSDVEFLPVSNTTAERIAQLLADQLVARLVERGIANIGAVEVEVEEAPGQSAHYARGYPA